MVLETGQHLVDRRRRPVGKLHEHGNHRLHAGLAGSQRLHFHRPAGVHQIPQCQVEEVNRFLQDPRTDPCLVVAPTARALPIRMTKKRNVDMPWLADGTLVDERADAAPLRRQPTLQADAQLRLCVRRRRNDAVAVGQRIGHRLFQQHVLAGCERGHGNRGVEMIGRGNGDGLNRRIIDQGLPLAMHRGIGEIGLCRSRVVITRRCDGNEPPVGGLGDGAGMEAAPGPVSGHGEGHWLGHAVGLLNDGAAALAGDAAAFPVK